VRLDERLHALLLGDGRRVRVGQPATVRLRSVNLARRQLDFQLVAWGPSSGAEPAHAGRERRAAPGKQEGGGRRSGRRERAATRRRRRR